MPQKDSLSNCYWWLNTHSVKEWLCGTSEFDVKFDKNFYLGAIFCENHQFLLDPYISDAKRTPSFLLGPIFLYI